MSTTIETDLKEIFAKFEQRFDRLDRIETDLTDLKISQVRVEEKLDSLNNHVQRLEDSQNKQTWALILAILGGLDHCNYKIRLLPQSLNWESLRGGL